MIAQISQRGLLIISALTLVVVWWIVTNYGFVGELFLPTPQAFIEAGYEMFFVNGFTEDVLISTYRVIVAWLFALIVAIPIAMVMSGSEFFRRLLGPYIDYFRYLPVPALIPLVILFFGIGETAKIALLFTGTVFQMVLLFLDNLDEVPEEYFHIAYSLDYTWWQVWKMKLLAAGANIYNNCRITMGWCWTYLVIAELVASQAGVGYVIKEAQRFSKTPEIYVGIFTLGIVGLFTDSIWKFFYPRVFKYKVL